MLKSIILEYLLYCTSAQHGSTVYVYDNDNDNDNDRVPFYYRFKIVEEV